MASTISAGTSAGTAIAIAGDTSGNLAFTTQAGTYTQTLPNATGTVMVSGNMPAFSAYKASTVSLTTATRTKITFTTEAFDTNSNYDTTNSRFTPTVAGYYLINAGADIYGSVMTSAGILIYKNGANYHQNENATYGTDWQCNINGIIYCNGTTDYIEIYAVAAGTSLNVYGNNTTQWTWFSGTLLRTA
jgi:hypothetical protein